MSTIVPQGTQICVTQNSTEGKQPQPQPEIDRQRLAQCMAAALRVLRGDPTITVTVTKRANGGQP